MSVVSRKSFFQKSDLVENLNLYLNQSRREIPVYFVIVVRLWSWAALRSGGLDGAAVLIVLLSTARCRCRDSGGSCGICGRPFRPCDHEVQRAGTDGAVFPESVRHISWVYPHRELRWEILGDVFEARGFRRFADYGVHFGVDSDTAICTASSWISCVPVVLESFWQQLFQSRSELVCELVGQVFACQHSGEELAGAMDFFFHDLQVRLANKGFCFCFFDESQSRLLSLEATSPAF